MFHLTSKIANNTGAKYFQINLDIDTTPDKNNTLGAQSQKILKFCKKQLCEFQEHLQHDYFKNICS